ncbi:MAG: bifunctional glycosyltransferase family 2/GtrA family protein, partial [Clostridia bacterium]|nr:bifunctional glycosyltransferase family 2/GtrA family protein [Clostridia bacterium]
TLNKLSDIINLPIITKEKNMAKEKKDIFIIIPALNPDEKMLSLIASLRENDYPNILLVDDGSKPDKKSLFLKAKEEYDCHLISHHINMGKGRALKYAFNHILTNFPEISAVVTADCDGQHAPHDITKLVETYQAQEVDGLILGVRKFDKKVPFKSNFGNKATRATMALFCGVKVSDANTGLRLFPRTVMEKFLTTAGDRFQYEINMLLETKEKEVPIVEVPIETIYYENNKSTHFRPIVDSFRIYSLFFKYIFSSLASFVVDILLFALFLQLTANVTFVSNIILSTVSARIISSVFNFIVNKKNVFKSNKNVVKTGIMYFVLAACTMIVSAISVDLLVDYLYFNEIVGKILVDTILFVINFVVQRDIIFKKKEK